MQTGTDLFGGEKSLNIDRCVKIPWQIGLVWESPGVRGFKIEGVM